MSSTIATPQVHELLPDAIVRPAIVRGDLYRDRTLGAQTFLLLDGSFYQQQAVSPREVIDVLRDGAVVVGASSMGALRAAECWPCGMLGVGLIYRLFRRGTLHADDEVAVSYDASRPSDSGTVSLVNVRYALRQAQRARHIDATTAERVLATTQASHFSERHWPTILRAANVDSALLPALASYDLKALDALRALRRVRLIVAQAGASGSRRRGGFLIPELAREREAAPAAGEELRALRSALLDWLMVSGRYRRYARTAVNVPRRQLRAHILAELGAQHELDAEIYKMRALEHASDRASRLGQETPAWALRAAERSLAAEHAVESYPALLRSTGALEQRQAIDAYRRKLARALWAARL